MKKIQIKGKDYVPVNERIIFFRDNEAFTDWQIITEILSIDADSVLMKASILNQEGIVMATGHGHEYSASSFINKTSYVENCETSAIGRALGAMGIGIDTSMASFEEVANAILQQTKKELIPGNELWGRAVKHMQKPDSKIEDITSRFTVSPANMELLLNSAI